MVMLTQGLSQLPVEINHPSQILIKRYSALGKLPLENFGNNSISAIEANDYLKTYDSDIIKIHKWNIQIPNNDTNKTNTNIKHKINYFIKGLTEIDFNKPKEFLYQSISESASVWISWREKIISQPFSKRNNGTTNDFQFLDEFSLRSIINNNIFISSKFSMFRHSGRFIWISNEYNNEWVKYFPAINMNFW